MRLRFLRPWEIFSNRIGSRNRYFEIHCSTNFYKVAESGRVGVKIVRISERNLELIHIFNQCYLLLEMSNYVLSLHVNFDARKSSLKKSQRQIFHGF